MFPRQTANRHVGQDAGREPSGIEIDRARPVGNCRHDFHADQRAGKTRHPEGMDSEVDHILLIARIDHRYAGILKRVLTLAGKGRRFGGGIVGTEQDIAPIGARSHGIGMAQHITRPVEPGRLAVPDTGYPIDVLIGHRLAHLAAPGSGRRQFLVDAWLVEDAQLGERRLLALEDQIEAAERRARIARNHRPGVQPVALIELAAQHEQPYERLDTGQDDAGRARFIAHG